MSHSYTAFIISAGGPRGADFSVDADAALELLTGGDGEKASWDSGSLAAYAQMPMAWAVDNGIVSGTADGHLAPAGTASRAQFAVILYRFQNLNV